MSDTAARWDAFLAKIRERGDETLAQAEEGCAMLLDVNALDPQPMSIAWMAIENELHELGARIDETWSSKVEPAFGEAPGLDAQRAKGQALRAALDRKKTQLELRIFGDAARKIYEQARINLVRDQQCAQCGAALKLERAIFRSRHLTCPFCSNVNTFVPGSLISSVEYFCAHHLARQKTAALWDAWKKSGTEQALREVTVAYLRARIEIVPEYEKDFEKDLKGKMAFFYQRG